MSQRPLKFEFEYSVRPFKNEYGDCYELTIKPAGDMEGVFPEGFERKMQCAAKFSLEEAFSLAAHDLDRYARYLMARAPVSFSDKAYFRDDKGTVTEVEPAVFIPH